MTSSSSVPAAFGPRRPAQRGDPWTSGSSAEPGEDQDRSPHQGAEGFQLTGLSLPQSGVLQVARAVVPPALAVTAGHGGHTGADQGRIRPAASWQKSESGAPAVGPRITARAILPSDSPPSTDTPTSVWPCSRAPTRTLGARLEQPVRLGLVPEPRGVPPQRRRPVRDCTCLAVNGVGRPGVGEPHAPFDRGPLAKREPWRAGTMHPLGNRWD
jgi:hypothetical protein